MNTNHKVEDFKPGDAVFYVADHQPTASGGEPGTVTSVNDMFVFVRFGEGDTSQACRPSNLLKLNHE